MAKAKKRQRLLLFDGCNYRSLLFSNPLFRGFFIFRAWKPPAPMAPDPTESLPIPWANRGNAPDRVVFFSPYGPFMEKSAFVCRKSRNPRVETPSQWA